MCFRNAYLFHNLKKHIILPVDVFEIVLDEWHSVVSDLDLHCIQACLSRYLGLVQNIYIYIYIYIVKKLEKKCQYYLLEK